MANPLPAPALGIPDILPTPIGIIGLGRAGSAIVRGLEARAIAVACATSPSEHGRAVAAELGLAILPLAEVAAEAALLILAVPDDVLVAVVGELASLVNRRTPQHLIHLSAHQSPAVLEPCRRSGDRLVAVHPLQVLAPEAGAEAFPGAVAAVGAIDDTSQAFGELFAETLGLVPFRLTDEGRALYHAAAVFAANFPTALLVIAQELATASGMPPELVTHGLTTLAAGAVDSAARLGTVEALTGPVVRGDVGSVRAHLDALDRTHPGAAVVYRQLTRALATMVVKGHRLTPATAAAIEAVVRSAEGAP